MQTLANILIDGLSYGMVLFVISIGMSVTLGLMRFINLSTVRWPWSAAMSPRG